MGFPHSDISGSQAVTRLPEAFRSYTASFIAHLCLGIPRPPLMRAFRQKVDETQHHFYAVIANTLILI